MSCCFLALLPYPGYPLARFADEATQIYCDRADQQVRTAWCSYRPDALVCEARPTCHSWQKKTAPSAFTAFTIGFQAATCSSVKMPGVLGSLHRRFRTFDCSVRLAQAVTVQPYIHNTRVLDCHSKGCCARRDEDVYDGAIAAARYTWSTRMHEQSSPEAAAGRACALGQHEGALACSLRVVLGSCGLRHSADRACPGERRIADAIDQRKRTQVERLEQRLVVTDVRGPCALP